MLFFLKKKAPHQHKLFDELVAVANGIFVTVLGQTRLGIYFKRELGFVQSQRSMFKPARPHNDRQLVQPGVFFFLKKKKLVQNKNKKEKKGPHVKMSCLH